MLSRKFIIQIFIISIGFIFIIKLFYIQIISSEFKNAAKLNTVQKVIEYPYRGEIYDKNYELLVHNEPCFDILIIPAFFKKKNIKNFCKLFDLKLSEFDLRLKKAKKYSSKKGSVIIPNVNNILFAKIQNKILRFSGISYKAKIIRTYPCSILANSIGYMTEINKTELNKSDNKLYYSLGDFIGANGLEKYYEKDLRGKKGCSYKIIDPQRLTKGPYRNKIMDTKPIPGKNIKTGIDTELQKYCDKLMQNKKGSIVAIDPSTGSILAMATYPSYNPNLIKIHNMKKNFIKIKNKKNYPLFNRSIMAMYPPGSIFKLVQALIALKYEVITISEKLPCDQKKYNVKCHVHPSPCNMHYAIVYSCNPYFVKLFKKIINQNKHKNHYQDTYIGLKQWTNSVKNFGLGVKLGIDIPNEKPGFIPDCNYYDKIYGKKRWKTSTIRSLDIGQGEMLVTPLQMANLAVIIANRGFFYTPHFVSEIGGKKIKYKKHVLNLKKQHFEFVVNAMNNCTKGTAWRAYTKDIDICAKTGTAENPHGNDHSVFMGFAPKNNPKIAISVYVENAGWGARAATALAGLILEKYINRKIKRKSIENYVLKNDFT